jgi:hypothetical protein
LGLPVVGKVVDLDIDKYIYILGPEGCFSGRYTRAGQRPSVGLLSAVFVQFFKNNVIIYTLIRPPAAAAPP